MSTVEITSETEDGTGWVFRVQAITDEGGLHRCDLRLSWSDYDYWCPGAAWPPDRVALAVAEFLVGRDGVEALGAKLDAGTVRRLHRDADAVIPGLVGRGEGDLRG